MQSMQEIRVELDLSKIRHPNYFRFCQDWVKFRFVYEGGRSFIHEYLEQFDRETSDEFKKRKRMTYSPSFAKTCLLEIKNSVYSRMNDITRLGGGKEYQSAITGQNGGVDMHGASMNLFIGTKVLEELLVMSKVGVMVDMPDMVGDTLMQNRGKRPYLYYYCAEDILSWDGCYLDGQYWYTKLLVRDRIQKYDETLDLPEGFTDVYRTMILTPEGVEVKRWTDESQLIEELPMLKLKCLPFVTFDISHSLLTDVADYQVALLNLASTDIDYALRGNSPFYTEQYEPRASSQYVAKTVDGSGVDQEEAEQVTIGRGTGRRYPTGADRPGFIHPSPEPLKASMEKQEQMKREMRQLMQLNASTLEGIHASAQSKNMDSRSLEAGLGYVGLELQRGEQQLAELWAAYMGQGDLPTINYPLSYELKSDPDRQAEATDLEKLMAAVPSVTYKKEVAKKIADKLLGNSVSQKTLIKVANEIDAAGFITSKPDDIKKDVELGLVTKATASTARGYNPDEVEKARKERAEDLALVQAAQTNNGARGIDNPAAKGLPDASIDPKTDKVNDGGGRPPGGK